MATLSFSTAYLVNVATTPAGKESNDHDFTFTPLGASIINDGTVQSSFSGNDVAVINAVVGGQTYYGWISRPIKDNGITRGFYFWTDQDFTSLAIATADGNTDGDSNVLDNLGVIFVVDQAWFDSLPFSNLAANLKNVKSSSNPVASELNVLVLAAPTVTITEDANNNGVIGAIELSGDVNVRVGLPSGAVANDVLTITDGVHPAQVVVLSAAQIAAGQVLTTFVPPANGGTITVTAYVSRLSVQGPSGSDSAVLDTTGPAAPTVVITQDGNNDGRISATEFSAPINVTVTLPVGLVAGDVLTVTDGTSPQNFTVDAAMIAAGNLTVFFVAPAEGGTITVTAFVTDLAGNVGASGNDAAVRDTTAPAAPTVVIAEDANNNGRISATEFSAPINVTVTLPAGAAVGDTLTVSDGINPQTFTVTQGMIDLGVLTTFSAPAEGGTITVTAFLTDLAGNVGAPGSDSAVLDTTAPGAPTVLITEDANNDALISATEFTAPIGVLVTLPGNAVVGDTLTVSDGISPQTFTVDQAMIDSGKVTTFVAPAEGGTITVTAFVTDLAGNVGAAGSDAAKLDTTAPGAPTVEITEDINNDGVISSSEYIAPVNVKVTLPAGVAVNDALTITDGISPQHFTVDAAMIASGKLTTFVAPAEGATITVTASVMDLAGNEGPSASDSALIDTIALNGPTVEITEDANNDGWISAGEFSAPVDVLVTLPGGVVVGDVLRVSDGITTQTFPVDAPMIVSGKLTSFAAPAEGGTITVTAFITDKPGNVGAPGSDSAKLDTTAPGAPTVEITEDINNDGVISSSEYIAPVNVKVTLPAGVAVNDALTITDGISPQHFTVDAAMIASGKLTTFTAPASGGTITVTAFVTDLAGNRGASASDSALLDTTAPGAPTVVITEDANNNGRISASEFSAPVNVTVTLPAGAAVGDTLTVSDGISPQVFPVDAGMIASGKLITFAAPAEGGTITVTAFVTDSAGNVGAPGSDSAVLDTAAPSAPTVVITEDANNDGTISSSELSGNVNVTIGVPAGVVVGDVLTVSDGVNAPQVFILDVVMISAGVFTAFAVPAEGGTITVTAFVTDQAGNQGANGSDSAVRDTSGLGAPTVVITEDANNSGVITASELNGDVDVTVTLPAGAVAGNVLTVTDGITPQTFTLTAGQIAAGQVLTSFTPPAEGATITVTARVTDQVGNPGATGTDSALRDVIPPSTPSVVIAEDANNDGILSAGELNGNVNVTVRLPASALAGHVLTVTDGLTPQTFVLTAAQITSGEVLTTFAPPAEGGVITVTAFVTNQLGVQGPSGSDSALRDTLGASAPDVVLTEDANNDGVLDATELNGDVNVAVGLPAGAVAGDVLTVTDGVTPQTFTLTAAQILAHQVLTSFAAPVQGATIAVTAYVTDAVGNRGASGSDSAVRDTAGPAAPVVVITEDANNDALIGLNELSGDVDVTVTLPAGAVAGDLLTITDGLSTQTVNLTAALIAAGSTVTSFGAPNPGGTITVTAYVTDQVGNVGASGSDAALREAGPDVGPVPLPAPVVVITEDANNDGLISAAELSGAVDVRVTLSAGAVAGDILTISDGAAPQIVTLTDAQIAAGHITTTFAAPPAGGGITVTAFITDLFGMRGQSGNDSAVREDIAPPDVIVTPDAVYSVLLENGDRFYSTDAAEAAKMAEGLNNVFEGVRFDSLGVEQGGVQLRAWYQPFTNDWYFAADGVAPPYECYELQPELAGFRAAAPGQAAGPVYHLYLNQGGTTQLVTQTEAGQLGLLAQGYADLGAQFATTALQAFSFDAEGYLVANSGNAQIRSLVQTLAGAYTSTADAGFIDRVEQDYLERVQIVGIAHGGVATAQDLNAVFGTAFLGG